jgi:putative photosynthetic complex assembly protein
MSHVLQKKPFFHLPTLIGALVAVSLIGVGLVRLSGYEPNAPRPGVALSERELRFEDRIDGSVAVLDARTGQTATTLSPGTNAFIRATLRGLAQDRMRRDLGPDAPFRLTQWADGRLSLSDPATGRQVELIAFGTTNAQAFARLLHPEGESK